jgi:hypothetical protein
MFYLTKSALRASHHLTDVARHQSSQLAIVADLRECAGATKKPAKPAPHHLTPQRLRNRIAKAMSDGECSPGSVTMRMASALRARIKLFIFPP